MRGGGGVVALIRGGRLIEGGTLIKFLIPYSRLSISGDDQKSERGTSGIWPRSSRARFSIDPTDREPERNRLNFSLMVA